LRSIGKAAKTRDDAQIRLDAALIHLELEPSSDIGITVLEGERSGAVCVRAGSPEDFQESPSVVLQITEVGRLRARGPASDAGELRDERAKAEAKLARLTEPFGTTDIDVLERLLEQSSELERRADEYQARLDGLLGGQTFDSLAAELTKYQTVAVGIDAQRTPWKGAPPDPSDLEQAAVVLGHQVREEMVGAERFWSDAENLASSGGGTRAAPASAANTERRVVFASMVFYLLSISRRTTLTPLSGVRPPCR
jgi:hypothetical protein